MIEAITTRIATPEDIPFIFSSWLNSFRKSEFSKHVPQKLYFSGHHRLIGELLSRSDVFIAVNEEDESQILGWICAEMDRPVPIFHYLYVKYPFRRMGIGRKLFSLMPKGPFIYTHETGQVGKLSHEGVYSPYALIGGHSER